MTGTFERLTAQLADRYRIERELGPGETAPIDFPTRPYRMA